MVSSELIKLRDFLVPENEPHRLVLNWHHLTEDEYGVSSSHKEAVRFCVLSGATKVDVSDATRIYLKEFMVNGEWKKPFLYFFKKGVMFHVSDSHTKEEVRDFLNQAIKYYSELGI